ncbi:DUF805 domain-containing protein [Enterobacter ludwigii]
MNKNVGTSYLDGWKKTFVYKGYATRKDFWSFVLVNLFIIFLVALGSFIWLMSVGTMAMVWIFFVLAPLYTVCLFLLIPLLSLGCRRMHDIEKSGWWFGGFVLFNVFGMPAVSALIGSIVNKWLPAESGSIVFTIIYVALSAVTFVIPVWLCCKPTKIKYPSSSSDVMN